MEAFCEVTLSDAQAEALGLVGGDSNCPLGLIAVKTIQVTQAIVQPNVFAVAVV